MTCAAPARAEEPAPSTPEPAAAPATLPEEVWLGPAADAAPVTLHDAVELALRQNFSILGSADALTVARLGEGSALAQFYPKLLPSYERTVGGSNGTETRRMSLQADQRLPWLGGTVTARGAFSTVAEPFTFGPRQGDLTLSLSQPLLRGFGPNATFFDLTSRRRLREGQERSFELARQALAEEVTEAFYEVVKQRQLLQVSRGSFGRNKDLLRASQARMEAGLASKLDVLRADLEVSFAEDSMLAAETGLQTARERFRVLLGLSPSDSLEPAAVTLSPDRAAPVASTEELIERALARRLDLLETVGKLGDARRSASLARQNLLPQLNLNVNVTRTGYGPSYRDTLRRMDQRVDVFLSTSYPLERTDDRAAKATADIVVLSSERVLRQRRLDIEAEVRSAVRNLERIIKSIELQKKGIELASQQHRLATLRYQRGIDSNFDVVVAEAKLVSARASLVSLLTGYEVARIHLLRTTGELDVAREFAP
jgi:outer membrane protein TolC